MNIIFLKLTTSEEIIGEVVDSTEESYTISNPLRVMLHPPKNPNEDLGFGFLPWGNLAKGDKSIPKSFVIYSAEPSEDLLNGYMSIFGVILTPAKQLIT